MKLPVLRTVEDVAARQLCCGCGACAAVEPERIEMIDALEHGRRPRVRDGATTPGPGGDAMRVCPGADLEHSFHTLHPGLIRELMPAWGPVLEVWEGHAGDDVVRHAASSGGAASAIAISCMEAGDLHGTLHVRARRDAPLLNETVLSTTRDEMLRATGSRYAPASPCDGLGLIEAAPGPCLFIGKPCDVAAVHKATRVRPALRGRVGLTIAIFCAGTPTTRATMSLLARLGIDEPSRVTDIRYRGNGWPGRLVVTFLGSKGRPETRSLSYEQSWGEVLANDKQWRCHVCADHSGEFADIAVGDPWHRSIDPGEPGRSLILVRTERGRRALRAARERGDLVLLKADPAIVARSQPSLLRARGAVWGRILALRLLGLPAPRYRGFPMFRHWLTRLSPRDKLRSTAGTVRRAFRRRLNRRVVFDVTSAPVLQRPGTTETTETTRKAA